MIFKFDITIGQDNIPQFSRTHNQEDVTVYVGNLNNATSFTEFVLDATSDNTPLPSIAVDSLGNTHVTWVDDGDVLYRKHNVGDAWSTWQTEVTISTGTYEDTSIAIDKLDRIVIMSTTSANVTEAWVSTDGGSTFGGGTTHNTGTVVDENVRLRWSSFFYEENGQFDYTLYDLTADDVYYNRLTIQAGLDLVRVDDTTEQISEGILNTVGINRMADETENVTESINRATGLTVIVTSKEIIT